MCSPVLLMLPFMTAAQTDGPPDYDAETYCKEVASVGGSYSAFMDNACLNQEQSAMTI
jgi:hypothetical protein